MAVSNEQLARLAEAMLTQVVAADTDAKGEVLWNQLRELQGMISTDVIKILCTALCSLARHHDDIAGRALGLTVMLMVVIDHESPFDAIVGEAMAALTGQTQARRVAMAVFA